MNFFTAGCRVAKEIDKAVSDARRLSAKSFDDNPDINFESIERRIIESKKRGMRYGAELALAYREIAEEYGLLPSKGVAKTFFITIRPECKKINFHTFKQDVDKYLTRAMFKHIYMVSYEQKGITIDTLGHGFHVHIIAETTCRSKGEVLRTTKSFESYTAPQCIQVDVCKNPEEHAQRYLVNYESKDGHKKITQQWDLLWREKEGIACPIKSDEGTQIIEIS